MGVENLYITKGIGILKVMEVFKPKAVNHQFKCLYSGSLYTQVAKMHFNSGRRQGDWLTRSYEKRAHRDHNASNKSQVVQITGQDSLDYWIPV